MWRLRGPPELYPLRSYAEKGKVIFADANPVWLFQRCLIQHVESRIARPFFFIWSITVICNEEDHSLHSLSSIAWEKVKYSDVQDV